MKDDYREELNQIHAPRELIDRTKLEMRKELAKKQKKIKIKIILKRSAVVSAAVVMIAIGGYGYQKTQNQIHIAEVAETSLVLNQKFGKIDQPAEKADIQLIKDEDENIIPSFLDEIKPSKVNGVAVKIGLDKQGNYHAGYQEDQLHYYIVGTGVSEAEFITYLKEKI